MKMTMHGGSGSGRIPDGIQGAEAQGDRLQIVPRAVIDDMNQSIRSIEECLDDLIMCFCAIEAATHRFTEINGR